jgi:autotransporter strand-loop-strand O-heptosyltransferase
MVVADDGETKYKYEISLKDKRVYIALDSKSIGDTLAWFPYVDEFRKKHECKVICSTFNNNLFEENYPHIEFVNPGDVVHNLYAMYTIGWYYNSDGNIDFNKIPYDFRNQPLQKTASDILGLDYIEIVPKIKLKPNIEKEKLERKSPLPEADRADDHCRAEYNSGLQKAKMILNKWKEDNEK